MRPGALSRTVLVVSARDLIATHLLSERPRHILFGVSTSNEPPKLVRRWESLSTPVQAAIVFPVLAVVFFFLNLVGFNQPVWRSIVYGLIESAPFTALVLLATASERRKRGGR